MIPAGLLLLLPAARTADLLWSAELESDDGGFVASGDTLEWEWGSPASGSGPGSCHGGSGCWGTRLDGLYDNDSRAYLRFPSLPLAGCSRPLLVFWHWYETVYGDAGWVEAGGLGAWAPLEPVYGYPTTEGFMGASGDWEPVYFDLSGLEDLSDLRLVFDADELGAASGWYVDDFALYDGDAVPPRVIELTRLEDTEDLEGPYPVEARIEDDVAVLGAELHYLVDGGAEQVVEMALDGGSWRGELPGQPADTELTYWLRATDGVNTVDYPEGGWSFRVRLPAPTGLEAEAELAWGLDVGLSWEPPDSAHELEGYRVYRDGEAVLDVPGESARAPLVSGEQSFSVAALYDVGEGDPSEPVQVWGAVPTVTALEPAEGYQGDHLRLRLAGESLLLVQGDARVELGDLRVDELQVRDVDAAYFELEVPRHAKPGSRDLLLWTGGLEVELPDAFTVLDGEERPHLESVEPASVRQGEAASLLLTASEPFLALPSVDVSGAVVVETVAWEGKQVPSNRLRVELVVPYGAAVGAHRLRVDDGTRIYEAELQVERALSPLEGGCGCAARGGRGGGLLAALLGLLAALLRRRPQRAESQPPSTGRLAPRT